MWEFTLIFFGAILSTALTIVVIRFFRPCLVIDKPEWNQQSGRIKIPVRNISNCSSAVNIHIEAALVDVGCAYTIHLKLDKDGFIMLPSPITKGDLCSVRNFQATEISDTASELLGGLKKLTDILPAIKEKDMQFRVRVHAQHSFTGFGKPFQTHFQVGDIFSLR